MNALTVVETPANWDRLKAMVLDSVSSRITQRVYNMALDVPGVVTRGAAAWIHKRDCESVAGVARGPRTRIVVDHYPHVGDSEASGRGRR